MKHIDQHSLHGPKEKLRRCPAGGIFSPGTRLILRQYALFGARGKGRSLMREFQENWLGLACSSESFQEAMVEMFVSDDGYAHSCGHTHHE
jgi:hypothetical protein